MKLLHPEEIIKQELHSDEPIQRVKDRYNFACGVMEKYKEHILGECGKDLQKVIARVNFLIKSCLNQNKEQIDQFLVDNCTFYSDGEYGIDYYKIINDGPKGTDQ